MDGKELITENLRFIYILLGKQFYPMVCNVSDALGIEKTDVKQECILYLFKTTIPAWLESGKEYSLLTYVKNGIRWQLLRMMKQVESKQSQFDHCLRTKNVIANRYNRIFYTRIDPEKVPSQDIYEDTIFDQLDSQLDAQMFYEYAKKFWNNRQARLVKMRFFDNLTLKEISEKEGVSSDRIRMILTTALRKVGFEIRDIQLRI